MKRLIHILMIVPLLLAAGCVRDMEPFRPASDLVLTVRCEDPALTKADPVEADGETRFNENLIESVDFFFYPGNEPATDADAVYHERVELDEDPVTHTDGRWEATFTLVLKRADAERIFIANDRRATVYAIVNYSGDLTAGGTSLSELAATAVETDFAATETDYIQPSFLMDGKTVITYNEFNVVSASGTIEVTRFAAKITTSVSVASQAILKHVSPDDPDEIWTPVLHTLRVYLVDGTKTVTLGTESSSDNPSPEFFSYSAEECRRPFVRDDGTEYLAHTAVGSGTDETIYYNTYPMYSYPVAWSTGKPVYSQDLPNQPYLKLEMDWRRTAGQDGNGYSYDRRKYYYKVILPVESLERNNWYHFNIDVTILGSETEEGQALLNPTTYYILDWQNKSVPIDKYAVISKARYLSVDKGPHYLNNLTTLSIPFLSSHDVRIVEGTVKATRPYYGEIKNESQEVNQYNTKYHAWVRKDTSTGTYYLEYNGQDQAPDGQGLSANEPSEWVTNTSTTIEFNHTLQNNYKGNDFDYSPYTIEFDIVHDDLTAGITPYDEYLKHITIIQYPGIYIVSCPNSDKEITSRNGLPYYPTGSEPWLNKPWGYVYIDNGRFIRRSKDKSKEPFFQLSTTNNKKEYQWRTVWYTSGGRDIFRINVTVLPQNSDFVIGDPRIDGYDMTVPVLGYRFMNDGAAAGDAVLTNKTGGASNFTPAKVVDGDVNSSLKDTGVTRPLMYYRPTDDSERTRNMVAPGYRISTKLGGTEFGGNEFANMDKSHAMWRCAGYQEDGFPGGRWRLPTMSEIKFIAQLSANGVFEFMFKGDYWSANGVVNVNTNGTVKEVPGATSALLRCVYDAWYWGDEQWNPRTEFVWGDRQP